MSLEINPVLAGTFDKPDYMAAHNVATAGAANSTNDVDDTSAADSRRYTKFDRSDTDAGSTTNFSFSDLLDMFNPLEHIPVVSSIYRAVTGGQINPVSRVTGDILYGGILGAASAVLGGVGAVADAGLEAEIGKDRSGVVLSALFGPDDKPKDVQVAAAGNAASTSSVTPSPTSQTPASQTIQLAEAVRAPAFTAALQVPQAQTSVSSLPTPAASVSAAQAMPAANPAAAPLLTSAGNTDAVAVLENSASQAAHPLNKQPYGGVMSPPNVQAQDMAIALSAGSPGMRLGHTIYTGRMVNGAHPLPPMLSSGGGAAPATAAPAVAPAPAAPAISAVAPNAATVPNFTAAEIAASGNSMPSGGAHKNPLPPELIQDMTLKALGQYRSIAGGGATGPGGVINLTN